MKRPFFDGRQPQRANAAPEPIVVIRRLFVGTRPRFNAGQSGTREHMIEHETSQYDITAQLAIRNAGRFVFGHQQTVKMTSHNSRHRPAFVGVVVLSLCDLFGEDAVFDGFQMPGVFRFVANERRPTRSAAKLGFTPVAFVDSVRVEQRPMDAASFGPLGATAAVVHGARVDFRQVRRVHGVHVGHKLRHH